MECLDLTGITIGKQGLESRDLIVGHRQWIRQHHPAHPFGIRRRRQRAGIPEGGQGRRNQSGQIERIKQGPVAANSWKAGEDRSEKRILRSLDDLTPHNQEIARQVPMHQMNFHGGRHTIDLMLGARMEMELEQVVGRSTHGETRGSRRDDTSNCRLGIRRSRIEDSQRSRAISERERRKAWRVNSTGTGDIDRALIEEHLTPSLGSCEGSGCDKEISECHYI